MTVPYSKIRIRALIKVLAVDSQPDWPGIGEGHRFDIEGGDIGAGYTRFSQIAQCGGTVSPGEEALVSIDMLSDRTDEFRPGDSFRLKRGSRVGVAGIVEAIEWIRRPPEGTAT
jgi:hypothetical protein